jgi:hypothetical protein
MTPCRLVKIYAMLLRSLLHTSSGSVVYLHRYFTCTFSDFVHLPYWFLWSVCEIIHLMLLMTICHCLKGIVNWPQLEFRQYCLFVLEFTLLTFITVYTKKCCKKCLPVFIWHIYFMYDRYEFISWHRSIEEFESECALEIFVLWLKWKQRHL